MRCGSCSSWMAGNSGEKLFEPASASSEGFFSFSLRILAFFCSCFCTKRCLFFVFLLCSWKFTFKLAAAACKHEMQTKIIIDLHHLIIRIFHRQSKLTGRLLIITFSSSSSSCILASIPRKKFTAATITEGTLLRHADPRTFTVRASVQTFLRYSSDKICTDFLAVTAT